MELCGGGIVFKLCLCHGSGGVSVEESSLRALGRESIEKPSFHGAVQVINGEQSCINEWRHRRRSQSPKKVVSSTGFSFSRVDILQLHYSTFAYRRVQDRQTRRWHREWQHSTA